MTAEELQRLTSRRHPTMEFVLHINGQGDLVFVYADELAGIAAELGDCIVARASHVEPVRSLLPGAGHPATYWTADMSPSGGPVLGPFPFRSDALEAEREWLEANLG